MLHVVVGNFLQGMVYFVQNYNLEQHQQIVRIIHFLTNKEVAHIPKVCPIENNTKS